MFEILLPLTGTYVDDAALPHALGMAQLLDGRVHLVRVLESRRASDRPIDPIDWHIKKLEAETELARALARLEGSGVEAEEALLEGHPTEHLVKYVRQSHTELVVLVSGPQRGSFGVSGGELLFRSYVTTLLLRPAAAPPRRTERGGAAVSRGSEQGRALREDSAFQANALSAALTRVQVGGWTPVTAARPSDATAAKVALVSRALSPSPVLLPPPSAGAASPGAGAHSAARPGAPAPGYGPAITGTASSGTPPRGSPVPGTAVSTTRRSPTSGSLPPASLLPGATAPGSSSRGAPGAGEEGADASEAVEPARYRRILAALDGSKRAEAVFSWVRQLSERHEAEVLLAHVVAEPELPRLTPATEEDLDLARRLVERNRAEATTYLEGARERLGAQAEIRLLQSRKVAVALHDLVDQEEVDLVVLSAHGYGGESRWPFGDVATNFIDYGATPILLVQDMARGDSPVIDVTSEKWAG